jgi:tetratricopeptide (TPR) repeat protein
LEYDEKSGLDPVIAYHLAHLMGIRGKEDQAAKYSQAARQMPTAYCFPYTLESIDVLREAMKANPADARAAYYLGNLLCDLQPGNAVREWEKARNLDDSTAAVHRNLAFAYARIEGNIPKAVSSMETAVARDPTDPRFLLELDQLYEAAGVAPQKRLEVLEKNQETSLKRDDILARQAALHVRLAQYDSAIALLSKHHFHIWEGGSGVRGTYVDAHLLRGRQSFLAQRYQDAVRDYQAANQYPENLEVAGAEGEESPRVDYLLAAAHDALGESLKAIALFERSAAAKPAGSAADFYRGLSLRRLGREEEAVRAFDGMIGVADRRISSAGIAAWPITFERRESRR